MIYVIKNSESKNKYFESFKYLVQKLLSPNLFYVLLFNVYVSFSSSGPLRISRNE